jgi:NAD(P)-dependent dehydrogenase (short-subunit alcohol dehydrogenase family)
MTLSGKIAVVTGGASGIGLATALILAERGAAVEIWDLKPPPADCPIPHIEVDLTNPAAVAHAASGLDHTDILVHSAGIQTYGTVTTTADDLWQRTLNANVSAAFYVCRDLLPKMSSGSSIILVGSVQSVGAVANSAAYVTSKHAILGLARSIALDYAALNIRANCICPGAIDTPMLRHSASLTPDPQATLDACAEVHPLNRLGTPEEIGRAIAFLASDDASFITGTAFLAEGGAMVPVGGMAFQKNGTAQACGATQAKS